MSPRPHPFALALAPADKPERSPSTTIPPSFHPVQFHPTTMPRPARSIARRIPFYFPLKTLFLLYLALPQTRGSSYLYRAHLHPFLATHEPQIDAAVASLRTRVYAFVHARARALWDAVSAAASSSAAADLADPVGSGARAGGAAAPPPSLGDPVSGPVAMLGGLWRTYGPAIVATGAAMLRQGAAASAGDSERALGEGLRAASASRSASGAGADAAERERKRRVLQADASLKKQIRWQVVSRSACQPVVDPAL